MKDTSNLLTHDQWSCTEYTLSTTGFLGGIGTRRESTNTWSKIGESSLKATKLGSTQTGFRVEYPGTLTGTVTGKLTLLSNSNKNTIIILYSTNSNGEIVDSTLLDVISPNIPVTVSLNIPANNTATTYAINITNYGDIGCLTFVDDISLSVS